MTIYLSTDKEKQTLCDVAEGWECIPTCYLEGFEGWVSQHFEELLRYYGAQQLSTEGF